MSLGGETCAAARSRRAAEIGADPDPGRRAQKQFFFDLEEAAHLAEAAPAVDAVHAAGQLRLLERLRGESLGRDPEVVAVEQVSRLVLGLLTRHFGLDGGIDVRAVYAALLRFGDAQLRSTAARPGVLVNHNGEPNGPEFFLFGELALMGVRVGVQVQAWSALVPALLGPQDVFCERYSNGPRRHVTGYRPVHAQASPPVDPAARADEVLSLGFEEAVARSTRIGRAAFRIFPSTG